MITGLPNYSPKKLALFGLLLGSVSGMYYEYADPIPAFIASIFGLVGLICLIVGIYRWIKQKSTVNQNRLNLTTDETPKQKGIFTATPYLVLIITILLIAIYFLKQGSEPPLTQRPNYPTINVEEIEQYLTGIVNIQCAGGSGSGSLWNRNNNFFVLTNRHVILQPYKDNSCVVAVKNDQEKIEGLYQIYLPGSGGKIEGIGCINVSDRSRALVDVDACLSPVEELDSAVALLKNFIPLEHSTTSPIKTLNYSISSLPNCPNNMPLGSPVLTVGYPAYSRTTVNIDDYIITGEARTVTSGIISGYDRILQTKGSGYVNYFVTAPIDSGNSGGIAFSKNTEGVCILGLPTWVSIGNTNTQGIIQNIKNVNFAGFIEGDDCMNDWNNGEGSLYEQFQASQKKCYEY